MSFSSHGMSSIRLSRNLVDRHSIGLLLIVFRRNFLMRTPKVEDKSSTVTVTQYYYYHHHHHHYRHHFIYVQAIKLEMLVNANIKITKNQLGDKDF